MDPIKVGPRPAVFIWLDVAAPEALDGQRARGRILPPRSFARHVARPMRCVPPVRAALDTVLAEQVGSGFDPCAAVRG